MKVQVSSSSQPNDTEQIFQNIKRPNDLYMLKHLEINAQLCVLLLVYLV